MAVSHIINAWLKWHGCRVAFFRLVWSDKYWIVNSTPHTVSDTCLSNTLKGIGRRHRGNQGYFFRSVYIFLWRKEGTGAILYSSNQCYFFRPEKFFMEGDRVYIVAIRATSLGQCNFYGKLRGRVIIVAISVTSLSQGCFLWKVTGSTLW